MMNTHPKFLSKKFSEGVSMLLGQLVSVLHVSIVIEPCNLDLVCSSGIYYVKFTTGGENKPTDTYGLLIVVSDAQDPGDAFQIWIPDGAAANFYKRRLVADATWVKVGNP